MGAGMKYSTYYLICIGVGIFIAAALLPWHHRLAPKEGRCTWFAVWAFFWPALLLYAAWHSIKAYRLAWWAYRDRQEHQRHLAQR